MLNEDTVPDPAWMDGVERQMAEHGAVLSAGRAGLVAALAQELASKPPEPFARPTLSYINSAPTGHGDLLRALGDNRRRDRGAGRSLIGPHRDEFQIIMAGKNIAAASCSTGEQKAMLIAIIIAHAGLAARGRPSLLLLDEVAAHLDPIRREILFERLRESGAQVWLTGTDASAFAAIEGEAAVWRIVDGQALPVR